MVARNWRCGQGKVATTERTIAMVNILSNSQASGDRIHAGIHGVARRHDLDWLRVIAFGILIFYHIGMFYVSWGWHVKSIHAGPASEPLMLIVNPWRLALLFFISGVAVRFAIDKAPSAAGFIKSRVMRLGLPIAFGIFLVVAPQSYLELVESGEFSGSFLQFWPQYLSLEQFFSVITPTWNHLWYVVYLLVYILITVPIAGPLRRLADGVAGARAGAVLRNPAALLLVPIIPFMFYEALLSPNFPTTHALWGDWANHAHRYTVFLMGFVIAKNVAIWSSIRRHLRTMLGIAVVIGAVRLYLRAYHWDFYVSLYEGVPVMGILTGVYAWACMLALFGFAMKFLNHPSVLLRYLTNAVFCYYILHQTIIIIAGYWLTRQGLSAPVEFAALLVVTVVGCALGYELFRRLPFLRLLLGIRESSSARPSVMHPAAA